MLTQEYVVEKLKELKPYLKEEYQVKEIGLFCSFSNNEQNKDSDILVEFYKPIGWNFFTLEKFLEETFNRKVDLVTKKALKTQLKDIILKQTLFL